MPSVVLLSPYFLSQLGYQEVSIAKTLHQEGWEVHVVSSTCLPEGYSGKPHGFDDATSPFPITRCSVARKFRSSIWADSSEMKTAVLKASPDCLIVINVPSGFARPILRDPQFETLPVVSFYSDAYEYRKRDNWKGKIKSAAQDVGFALLQKKEWYREAFRRSSVIVANSPETKDILMSYAGTSEYEKKMLVSPLGANTSIFFFDHRIREAERSALGFTAKNNVVVTVTKVMPEKGIEQLIDTMKGLIRQDPDIRYLIAGSMEDDYVKDLHQLIAGQDSIRLLPQLGPEQLNRLYNAADIGLWYYGTIAIQEAMVTGVRVIIPDRRSMSHLLETDPLHRGMLYRTLDEISVEVLGGLFGSDRESVVGSNGFIAYRNVLDRILALVGYSLAGKANDVSCE